MNRDSSFPCSPLSLHGNIMQPDASHPEDGLEPYSDYHTNHGRTNSDSALASVEITGRKMWKTLRERKSEAVWPPKLESALLEALKKYRPTSSRDPKQLQRFPKRNRFISDYVFQATGQRRTPKQVGSRLQQIRDTCSEEHILKLLTRPDLLPPPDEPLPAASFYEEGTSSHLLPPLINETPSPSYTASVSPSSASYPLPTLSPAVAELGLDPEPTMQFDDMSFYSATPPLPPPSPFVEPANVCIEFVTAMSSSPSDTMPLNSTTRHLKIVAPNPLWNFVPTVSFTSSTQLVVDECRAVARVFIGDSEIHHEESEIAVLGNREDKWLYGSKLVPSYWVELCKTTGQDLSDCRILQVIENHSSSSEGSIKPLFSIIYSFKHHPPPKPPASNSFPISPVPGETQLPPLFPPTTLHSSYSYSLPRYRETGDQTSWHLPHMRNFYPRDTNTSSQVSSEWEPFNTEIFIPAQGAERTFDNMSWYYSEAYNPTGNLVLCNISRHEEGPCYTPDAPKEYEDFYQQSNGHFGDMA